MKQFIAVGDSQAGKSSLANTLSEEKILPEGTGDGKSCTRQVIRVSCKDTHQVTGSTEFNYIDCPGFYDTTGTLSDQQVKNNIRIALAGCGSRTLTAVFLVVSMAGDTIGLRKLFQRTELLFGPTVLRSCAVIVTKGDLLNERLISERKSTIESVASERNVPVVYWLNHTDELVPDVQMKEQVINLRQALANVPPFEMTDMQTFEAQVESKSKELALTDPDNVERKEVVVQYEEPVKYEVQETYTVPVEKNKYPTEQAVLNEARRLQALPQNLETYSFQRAVQVPVKKCRKVPCSKKIQTKHRALFVEWYTSHWESYTKLEEYYENETRYEPQVGKRQRPLEYFASTLRNEKFIENETRTRTVTRTRTEKRTKTEIVIAYKRDWTCYRSQAAKLLIA